MADKKKKGEYRSIEWFGRPNRDSMVHRSWKRQSGADRGRDQTLRCDTGTDETSRSRHGV